MWRVHCGKMRDWFSNTTRWSIVSLDTVNDLANLVFLECDGTKREGLVIPDGKDFRILGQVAKCDYRKLFGASIGEQTQGLLQQVGRWLLAHRGGGPRGDWLGGGKG